MPSKWSCTIAAVRAALLAMLLICQPAMAGDWETKDTALLGGALGLIAVDWAQTRDLVRSERYVTPACADPETRRFAEPCAREPAYREFNPLLPTHPSTRQVDTYFVAAIIGIAGLSYAMPTKYRRYFLGGVIVLESLVVLNNHRIGLRIAY